MHAGGERHVQLPQVAATADEGERRPIAEIAHHVYGFDAADVNDDLLHATRAGAHLEVLHEHGVRYRYRHRTLRHRRVRDLQPGHPERARRKTAKRKRRLAPAASDDRDALVGPHGAHGTAPAARIRRDVVRVAEAIAALRRQLHRADFPTHRALEITE